MPFFVKIQNVYRASRKLRPTIRTFERYKSFQGATIGDQKNKVGGNTSDNRINEEFDSNLTISSRVKIEEPESGLIINLDLDYSFKTVPANIDDSVVTDEAIVQSDKDSPLRPILESYFSASGDSNEGPICKELQVDTPHLLVMAKPTPNHSSDPAHLRKGSGTEPTITKQNPVPVRYNAKVRGTIDINSKKLTNQQLGDTLRTVVSNVVGNAFQTLLQNAHSHGMSTKSMTNQENQPLPFTINEMRVMNARGMSSSNGSCGTGKQNGGKSQNSNKSKNGGHAQDVDYEAIKTQILDEATITPPGRSRPKPQTKKCSLYSRDPDVRATCKVNRAPCKKKNESSSRRTDQCGHVSAFTAHSGSVMSNAKSSLTEKKEVVEETKRLQRDQRPHTIDTKVFPKEKALSDLANDSFTLTATQINPSRSFRASKKNTYNNVDVPPFYHILPKYKEHIENKQKKTLTEDLTVLKSDIAPSKGSDTKLSKVLHENNSTKSSNSEKETKKSKKAASRLSTDDFKNLLDSIREPSKKVQEKKTYNEIPMTENILSTPLRSDKMPQDGKECDSFRRYGKGYDANVGNTEFEKAKQTYSASFLVASRGSDRNEKNPTTSKQDSGKGAGSEKTEGIDCSLYLQSEGSGKSSDKSGQNKNPISCRGSAPTGPQCKSSAKTTGNSSKSECGGISNSADSLGSFGGSSSIDCGKLTTGVGAPPPIDCSKYISGGGGTVGDQKAGAYDKKVGAHPPIDCSKYTLGRGGTVGDQKAGASDTKVGALPAIDCSIYKSGRGGTEEDQKSDASDKKVGAPPPIDCSKYTSGGRGTMDDQKAGASDKKVGAPPPIDCSKYTSGGGETVDDQKASASDKKVGAPPPIDCSKYTSGGSGTVGDQKAGAYDKKVGAPPPIDCSKYTSGGGGTVGDQKSGEPDKKVGAPPPIDCSKYTSGGRGIVGDQKAGALDKKVGAPPPTDCSKYTSGGAGTVGDQKAGASDKKVGAPPPIDCSKYTSGGGETVGDQKAGASDKKVGAPPPIDCSKYTSGGGGTVGDQKSGESDKKVGAPPPIDCSIYKSGKGGTVGDQKSDASDKKVGAPPPIDCSKYTSGGGGTVGDQKAGALNKKVGAPSPIDCSKYTSGGGGTVGDQKAGASNKKVGAPSPIDCSKYTSGGGGTVGDQKSGASDKKVGAPPPIDCSKYTSGGGGTVGDQKSGESDKKVGAPPPIDCSIYKSGRGGTVGDQKSDASDKKVGAPPPIDCSKYTSGGGGTVGDQKAGALNKKVSGPSPIDCSKYTSGGGETVGDQKAGASDKKVGAPPPIDCSKYTSGGGGIVGDQKSDASDKKVGAPPPIDCSKYKAGGGGTARDTSTKSASLGASSEIQGCGGVKLDNGEISIDCSAIKSRSETGTSQQPTSPSCCSSSGDPKPGKSTVSPPSNSCQSLKIEITDKITSGNIRVESSTAQQTKPKTDFCRAREPKSKVNKDSGTNKRNCLPVMCSKGKRLEVKTPEPVKRIPIEDTKSCLFNCSLKIAGSRKVEILNSAMPKICDDHVMIKMHTVGLCGSDVYMFDKGIEKIDNCDISLGHEGSGIVIEAGRNVKHLKEGDPVSIEPGIPCCVCKYCKMGRYNICPNMNFSGLLSTYCAHPAHFCYKIPETMKLEDAALAHPLSLGLHACHRGKVTVGSKVLILGACPLGISTVISARAMGANKVAIIDTLEKNLKVAHDLCADKTILANNAMSSCELAELVLSEMKCRPNVVIDCCGCTKTVNMSILAVEQGGLFVLAGCQSECANIPILAALAKEICFHTSFRSSNMFPKAIGLISSGRADVRKMITHRHEFCESQKAFDSAVNEVESGAVKVVVNWPNSQIDNNNKKPKT